VTRRLSLLVAGLVGVVVIVIVAVIMINPFSRSPGAGSAGPSAPGTGVALSPVPRVSTTVNPAQAPTPPARGAYFGAAVGPDVYTQANEINAVTSLQRQLGRKLAIVHAYVKWQAPFPRTSDLHVLSQGSILFISWAGTAVQQITSGADDSWIRTRARQIKALGKPVFLEWRWEMDRPNLRSEVRSGADYVRAWEHIRAIFAAVGVHNAAWVWCPTARGFSDGQAASFYPGDRQVDWLCADAYPPYGSHASFASTIDPFLSWASHRHKPLMIGEFGVPQSYGPLKRAHWLQAAQRVVLGDPQIKALVYFDANPAGLGPAERYSLNGDAAALRAFRSIARQPYFNPAAGGG
jgi:hypothetical protein